MHRSKRARKARSQALARTPPCARSPALRAPEQRDLARGLRRSLAREDLAHQRIVVRQSFALPGARGEVFHQRVAHERTLRGGGTPVNPGVGGAARHVALLMTRPSRSASAGFSKLLERRAGVGCATALGPALALTARLRDRSLRLGATCTDMSRCSPGLSFAGLVDDEVCERTFRKACGALLRPHHV